MKTLKESILDTDFDYNLPVDFKGGPELAQILLDGDFEKFELYDNAIRSRGKVDVFKKLKEFFKKTYKNYSGRNCVRVHIREKLPSGLEYIRIAKTNQVVPGGLQCDVYTIEDFGMHHCQIVKAQGIEDTRHGAEPTLWAPIEVVKLLDHFLV